MHFDIKVKSFDQIFNGWTSRLRFIIFVYLKLGYLSVANGYMQVSRRFEKTSKKRAENKNFLKRAKSENLPLITLNCQLITIKKTCTKWVNWSHVRLRWFHIKTHKPLTHGRGAQLSQDNYLIFRFKFPILKNIELQLSNT